MPKGDIGRGLSPPPPDLAKAAPLYSPAELFWIVKHGIKMTGMPAWSDHSDEELWATVAFLEKLPGMSEQDYARLVVASLAHGGMIINLSAEKTEPCTPIRSTNGATNTVFLGAPHDRNERPSSAVVTLCVTMMTAEIVGGMR